MEALSARCVIFWPGEPCPECQGATKPPLPDDWVSIASTSAAPRQAQLGELLFEFHVPATHTFYRVELRDYGTYGVEAQFLDPVDIRIARTFRHAARDGDRVGG